jgi:6-phosphogluconolactonase (cycloisomerase 2 family)
MTMRVRMVLMLMVALAMMGLASCGHYNCKSGATFGNSSCTASGSGLGGGGGASGTAFAYLLGGGSMIADELDLGTNTFQEDISFVAPPVSATGAAIGGTVVVSKGTQKYLYVPFTDGTLYGYAIDGATGALTTVSATPYAAPGGNAIAGDPAGNFLFVSDSSTDQISAFSIAADGTLTSLGSFPSLISAGQLTTDGLGKYLYAAAGPPLGGPQIAAFVITPGVGTLTPVLNSPFTPGFNVTKLVGENTGAYLFGINGLTANLYVFTLNAGVPRPPTPPFFATAAVPEDLVVNPSGKFVYTFNGSLTPMEGYLLDTSTGGLTAVAGSPFTGVDLDEGQFDQSGIFLFGAGLGAGATFGPYDISSTGAVSASKFPLLGFLGGSFAVTDLDNAP